MMYSFFAKNRETSSSSLLRGLQLLVIVMTTLAISSHHGAAAFSPPTPTKVGRPPNQFIKIGAQAITAINPIFIAEAKLQAALLSGFGRFIDAKVIDEEVNAEISTSPIVVYAYSLCPFCRETVSLLKDNGYSNVMHVEELGLEFFLLGPKASVKRVVLGDRVPDGATSLPKVFVNGECIGGCAALAELVEADQAGGKGLEPLLKQKKSIKQSSSKPFWASLMG
uniref:Glutaredoxin domain-containing protein n=1 Tax=Amphora coffeiformis TaxID=265554 RepID=A0A7S3PAU3_9STRA|mmetsp:Transcript_1388/g.2827  ORF Transcript_1388/g.2827 Transcript_1388/m.2827 type:complete len:224 (-) Transcript_1388:57-728(-)|eukprot:scaffold1029_cov194-Amphora_coffeaeformis.AAC.2